MFIVLDIYSVALRKPFAAFTVLLLKVLNLEMQILNKKIGATHAVCKKTGGKRNLIVLVPK